MASFIEKLSSLADEFNVEKNSLIYKYIEKKTKASERGSKARRSLGNLYALYVLCKAYNNNQYDGDSFTNLMKEMKLLPFGSKLQNHPLDNRLNDEFRRSFNVSDAMLPVQNSSTNLIKKRRISEDLLSENGVSPEKTSMFVTQAIDSYIKEIENNQNTFLEEIESYTEKDEIIDFINKSFEPNSDARLFEITSHAVLSVYFSRKKIKIENEYVNFKLFKTGRTNANDGGIDFVLTPIGKFFQVTEVLDFRKYFLDFDKINRFPMSFVVKTEFTPEETLSIIKSNSDKINKVLSERYMGLFDEIITLPSLREIMHSISDSNDNLNDLKRIIIENFKLEYGLLD
jgi:hypothetical protein